MSHGLVVPFFLIPTRKVKVKKKKTTNYDQKKEKRQSVCVHVVVRKTTTDLFRNGATSLLSAPRALAAAALLLVVCCFSSILKLLQQCRPPSQRSPEIEEEIECVVSFSFISSINLMFLIHQDETIPFQQQYQPVKGYTLETCFHVLVCFFGLTAKKKDVSSLHKVAVLNHWPFNAFSKSVVTFNKKKTKKKKHWTFFHFLTGCV